MTNELKRTRAKLALLSGDINSPVFWVIFDVLKEALQKEPTAEEFIMLTKNVGMWYSERIRELEIPDSKQQKLFKDE